MKISLRSLLVIAGLTAALNASATDAACCKKKKDAACCGGTGQACCAAASTNAAAAPAAYPLDTCVVSEEKLGSMGQPYEYVYKQEGKPDRTVLLCCKGCVKDFQKEPAKYLKLIDDAAAAKAKSKS